nr:phosphoglycerate dehydrogenase [Roseospira visakhapatnamensis]
MITARSVAANAEGRATLEAAGHEVVTHVGDGPWPEDEMRKVVAGMDAAIVGLDAVSDAVLSAGAPTLKVVARNGVGYNRVDVVAAARLGVAITLAPGANTVSVCELVFGLMLSLARQIPAQDMEVRKGVWKRALGCELYGKTLGVIGTGNIGREVIRRARAFGMSILAFDVVQHPELTDRPGVVYADRRKVLTEADFVTLHVPVTPDTREMVNAETLATMKPSAIIINTARGELVNEADLHHALTTGQIAGYGADTFSTEPPDVANPLLARPNVIVTPHAGAYTAESVSRCSVMAAEEVVRVLSGRPPRCPAPVPA